MHLLSKIINFQSWLFSFLCYLDCANEVSKLLSIKEFISLILNRRFSFDISGPGSEFGPSSKLESVPLRPLLCKLCPNLSGSIGWWCPIIILRPPEAGSVSRVSSLFILSSNRVRIPLTSVGLTTSGLRPKLSTSNLWWWCRGEETKYSHEKWETNFAGILYYITLENFKWQLLL